MYIRKLAKYSKSILAAPGHLRLLGFGFAAFGFFVGCATTSKPNETALNNKNPLIKVTKLNSQENTNRTAEPIIIAHRGASGYLPEHTLEAYEKAIEMGADFIEPDIVSTKDGVLVARHENNIEQTTNVASKFPDRKRTKVIDGITEEGFFIEDFSLAEIKTLRAKERLEFRPSHHNGKYLIPTFAEIVSLVKEKSRQQNRRIGIYPESKHPSYHRSIGLPLEEKIIETLKNAGWHTKGSPVFLQSFEPSSLKIFQKISPLSRVQLISNETRFADLVTDTGLSEVSKYANGIGIAKELLFRNSEEANKQGTPNLVKKAHDFGLFVHVWTFRNESRFLLPAFAGNPNQELSYFFAMDVDGVFADFPDSALAARNCFTSMTTNKNRFKP